MREREREREREKEEEGGRERCKERFDRMGEEWVYRERVSDIDIIYV